MQAVPLGAKKAASVGKSSETPAALLQLPHFDGEVLRQLARKKVKTMAGKGVGMALGQQASTRRHALLAPVCPRPRLAPACCPAGQLRCASSLGWLRFARLQNMARN